jgi:hypothetical protein
VSRAINRCPSCGSTVSQFAAGCAICGADLTAARRDRAQRRTVASIPAVQRLPRVNGEDAVLATLLIVAAFASPLFGGVIAGLFALQAHNDRDFVRRNLCLIAVTLAVVMICLFSLLPGTYSRLLLLSIHG